jgi:hypothetical protein
LIYYSGAALVLHEGEFGNRNNKIPPPIIVVSAQFKPKYSTKLFKLKPQNFPHRHLNADFD